MTATASPPVQDAPRQATADRPAPRRSARSSANPSLFVWAEVALASVTAVTVAGLWRLFIDRSYLAPLLVHVVLAHVVAAVLRRRGLSLVTSALIVIVCAALALAWGHLGHTTAYGLPTGETWRVGWDRLSEAWHGFDDVKAPAPVLPGFMLALVAVVWAIAWSADTAAFRLWAPFESLIPAGTLFVFASLFAADEARLAAAALWLAAALGFVLVQRTARQQSSPSWLGSDPTLGTRALLRGGAAVALAAVAVSLLGGPNLPGSGDDALIEVDPDRGNSRQTVSPLVEIQGRLLEQSDTELFSVTTSQRAYWRLTSLDRFDGAVWFSRGSYGRAEGELEGVPDDLAGGAEVTQSIEINGLNAIWVPAAFEPRAVEADDAADIRWEAESSTLIVSTDHPTSDGLIYQVTSLVPAYDAATLQAADGHIPRSLRSRNIDLPPEFPRRVVDEARRIVQGAATPYDQARALQDYFRDGSFTYSLSAPSGHSDTAIESFLFETRTGYCEQFAGSYAAMARAVGLPARVAVGFTPGEQDPLDPERYIVRGEHAHAWPEVYIAGAGWVAFEPTPTRGAPGALSYTGVEESQDTPGPSTDPIVGNPGPQFPTEQGAGGGLAEGSTTTLPLDPNLDAGIGGEEIPTDQGVDGRDILGFIGWALLAVVAFAFAVVLGGALVALTRTLRRARRRARATSAEDKVRVAWAEAVESVEVLGVTPKRYETPLEFARRIGAGIGADPRPLRLARAVEQADFAPTAMADEEAEAARELAHGVRAAVRERTTTSQRVLNLADPRPPERRGRRRTPRPTGPRIEIQVEPA